MESREKLSRAIQFQKVGELSKSNVPENPPNTLLLLAGRKSSGTLEGSTSREAAVE